MAKPILTSIMTVAAIALGGCQTTFDLVGVAVPLSASDAHRYDGSYQGHIDLVASKVAGCPASEGERVLMVGDGVLWYAYSPSTLFTLPVGYNGEISGTTGETVMKGKIQGNHLALTIKSPSCQTEVSMNYIYNHS